MKKTDSLFIAAAMKKICPRVLIQLEKHWDNTLASYIQEIWQTPVSCSSKIAIQSRTKFYAALKLFFIEQPLHFERIFSEFERYPILQTGPHCQLYTNSIDFNAFLMSWMGSQLHQLNYTFILNSVTRTLQWGKQEGPGWINLKHKKINLFNLPSKKMSRMSVCSRFPNLTYHLDNLTNYVTESEHEKKGVEKLLGSIHQNEYEGFIPAFTLSNKNLIKRCDINQRINTLIMNDHFTSILVAEHLKDSEGIIYNLIFSSQQRNKLNQIISSLKKDPSSLFLKQGTEYFWGLRDNKIRALKIEGKHLIENTEHLNKQIKIPFNQQAICKALLKGQLIPNIFLSFLVLSIMPQIRVLGGTRQIAYHPLIQKIFCTFLSAEIPAEKELLEELLSNQLNIWGANFIQSNVTPLEWLGRFPEGKELPHISTHYLNKSIAETTQNLIIFKDHPLWKQII